MTVSVAPAEVARDQPEEDREDRRDERRGDADQQRVAAAVEQPHHDVAPVAVGAEEELAVGLEPLRPDRHAVEADHVLLLAVDLDRVREMVRVRRSVFATLSAQIGAATQASTSSDEEGAEEQRDLVAPQAPKAELPRAESVDVLPLSLLLPGSRPLKGRFGCGLSGHSSSTLSSPSRHTLPDRGGRRSALPQVEIAIINELLEAPARVVVVPDRVEHASSCRSPSAPRRTSTACGDRTGRSMRARPACCSGPSTCQRPS